MSISFRSLQALIGGRAPVSLSQFYGVGASPVTGQLRLSDLGNSADFQSGYIFVPGGTTTFHFPMPFDEVPVVILTTELPYGAATYRQEPVFLTNVTTNSFTVFHRDVSAVNVAYVAVKRTDGRYERYPPNAETLVLELFGFNNTWKTNDYDTLLAMFGVGNFFYFQYEGILFRGRFNGAENSLVRNSSFAKFVNSAFVDITTDAGLSPLLFNSTSNSPGVRGDSAKNSILIVYPDSNTLGGRRVRAARVPLAASFGFQLTVNYAELRLGAVPAVLGYLQTNANGGVLARLNTASSTSATFYLQPHNAATFADANQTGFAAETFGYIVVESSGDAAGAASQVATGNATVDERILGTVVHATYPLPVTVACIGTNGAEAAYPVLSASSPTFSLLRLSETPTFDGDHVSEPFTSVTVANTSMRRWSAPAGAFSPVVIGAFGIAPYGTASGFVDPSAMWIWSDTLQTTDTTFLPRFYTSIYHSAATSLPVVIHFMVDNYAQIYLNDVYVGEGTAGWTTTNYPRLNASLAPGFNRLMVRGRNDGGTAALIVSVVDARTNTVLTRTDASWSACYESRLDLLTPAARAAAQGCYAVRCLSQSYTGPTLRLRRSSDNTISDFFANLAGALGTGANATGTLLAAWLAAVAARTLPPANMTANTSVLGTGATAGTYVASASTSINGTQPFNAFRLSLWHSASTYNVSTGLYIGTVTTSGLGGATYSGEWLQLQLPFPIRLGSYTIRGRQDQNLFLNRSPNTFVILGSDTGANGSWRLLDSRTDATFTADAQTFTIASPPSYACMYFRLVVSRVGNPGTTTLRESLNLSDVRFIERPVAFVETWYDQSGMDAHATNANATFAPFLNDNGTVNLRYTDPTNSLTVSRYFNLPNGTIPFNDDSYTFVFRHGAFDHPAGGLLGSGNYGVNNQVNAIRRDTGGYFNSWWNADSFVTVPVVEGNVVSVTYDKTQRYWHIDGSYKTSTASSGRASTALNNTLGKSHNTETMNGDLCFAHIFNRALSNVDRGILETTDDGLNNLDMTSTFLVRHPTLNLYWSFHNGKLRLSNVGAPILFMVDPRSDVYGYARHRYAVQALNNGQYLQHSNLTMTLGLYAVNSLNFGWLFLPSSGAFPANSFRIYNDFPNGDGAAGFPNVNHYAGYDSGLDEIRIVPFNDSRVVDWVIEYVPTVFEPRHMHLQYANGAQWVDVAGNDYHASYVGTVVSTGNFGGTFTTPANQITQYILLNELALQNLPNGNSWTLTWWSTLLSNANLRYCMSMASAANENAFNIEFLTNTYRVHLSTLTAGANPPYVLNIPFMITVVRINPTTFRIYHNGVFAAQYTKTDSVDMRTITGWVLDQEQDVVKGGFSAAQNTNANWHEIMMYTRALSEAEILADYERLRPRYLRPENLGRLDIVITGLALYYDPLDTLGYAGSGTVLPDLSGNARNGTLSGGATVNRLAQIVLNGSPQYVATTFLPNLDNLRQYTYELWFWDNAPGTTENTALISNYGPTATTGPNGTYSSTLHINNTGQVIMAERNAAGVGAGYTYPVSICNSVWTHVVMVANATQLILYINGVNVSGASSPTRPGGVITTNTAMVIGGNHLGRYQTCRLGPVRIYLDKALTAAEVLQNYNAERNRRNVTSI